MGAWVFVIGGLIATVGGAGLAIAIVWWENRGRFPWAAAAVMLPVAFVVNMWIKRPLFIWLFSGQLGFEAVSLRALPWAWALVLYMLTPVIEETFKVFPAWRASWRQGDHRTRVVIGFALGAGYGVSEIWYLAWRFSLAFGGAVPVAAIWGFASERLLVVLGHGAATMVAAYGVGRGLGPALGYWGLAVGLHSVLNIGPGLHGAGKMSLLWATTMVAACTAVVMYVAYLVAARDLLRRPVRDMTVLFKRDDTDSKT